MTNINCFVCSISSVGHIRILFIGIKKALQFYLLEICPVPPVFDGSAELESLIAQYQLSVKHVIGVHGRSGTREDFLSSIVLRDIQRKMRQD